MGRPPCRPRREEIYRDLLGDHHPLLPLACVVGRRTAAVGGLVRYLVGRGVEPMQATQADLEGWARHGALGGRPSRVSAARLLFRSAHDAGLIPTDPSAGLHYYAETVHAERRLTDAELRRLLDATFDQTRFYATRLAARRDLLMILLLCWRPLTREELRALHWSDIRKVGESTSIKLAGEWFVLPTCLAESAEQFRSDLAGYGAPPVPDDALLPALGKRVEVSWRGPERPLMAPMGYSGFAQAIKRRMRPLRLDRPVSTRRLGKPIWFYRDGRPFDPWPAAAEQTATRVATAAPSLFRRHPQRDEDGSGTSAEVA